MESTLIKLRKLVSKELPGFDAHIQMMPEGRVYKSKNNNSRKSAVNIITYLKNDEFFFILTQRATGLSNHSGQISLPGGSKDKEDENLWETAKRETFEEIGIKIGDDEYVGELTPLYIDVSNFIVYPFVSFLKKKPLFNGNVTEVEKIFEVKFSEFFDKKNKSFSSIKFKGREINFPFFKLDKLQVWGATSMILQEFFLIFKNLYSF